MDRQPKRRSGERVGRPEPVPGTGYRTGATGSIIGDPTCHRSHRPTGDLRVTIADEERPECGARLPEDGE
jgi:hypothetical protein